MKRSKTFTSVSCLRKTLKEQTRRETEQTEQKRNCGWEHHIGDGEKKQMWENEYETRITAWWLYATTHRWKRYLHQCRQNVILKNWGEMGTFFVTYPLHVQGQQKLMLSFISDTLDFGYIKYSKPLNHNFPLILSSSSRKGLKNILILSTQKARL